MKKTLYTLDYQARGKWWLSLKLLSIMLFSASVLCGQNVTVDNINSQKEHESVSTNNYLQYYYDYIQTFNPVNYCKNNKTNREDGLIFVIDTATVYSVSSSPKKYTYTYSIQGYRLSTLTQIEQNGSWENSTLEECTYDEAGNELTSVWKYWSNNEWVNSSRTTNSYSTANNLLSTLSEIWEDDVWKYNEMDTYMYNTGGKVVSHITQVWTDGDWANLTKEIYTYDDFNNLITALGEVWQASAWREDQQYVHTYDANNNMVTVVYDQMESGVWVHISKDTNTYNEANKKTMDLNKIWNDSVWVNNLYYTYSYTDLDYLESSIGKQWLNNDWVNFEKHYYSYGEYGAVETEIASVWDNGDWVNNYMKQYGYDDDGNALSGNYYYWEGGNWAQNQEAPLEMFYCYAAKTEVYFGYSCDASYSSMLVGVEDNSADAEVAICYPNPFNNSTNLHFKLNDYSFVRATLYDINGREIKNPVSNYLNPGVQNIQISLEGLKTGLYFLKLYYNNRVQTLTLSLIK